MPSERSLVRDDSFLWRLLDESCGYGAEARQEPAKIILQAEALAWNSLTQVKPEPKLSQTAPCSDWIVFFYPLYRSECGAEMSHSLRILVLQWMTSSFSSAFLNTWDGRIIHSVEFS